MHTISRQLPRNFSRSLHTPDERQHGRAFTLVELLVGVAVISIPAALLLPSFAGAKAAALSTACKSNLRQMGIALSGYYHEEQYYPLREHRDTRVSQFITYAWMAHLLPSVSSNTAIFRCPARGHEFTWPDGPSPLGYPFPFNVSMSTPFSYGCNAWGVGNADGYGLGLVAGIGIVGSSKIANPADMIAIGDSDGSGSLDGDIACFRVSAAMPPPLQPGNLHKNGANIVFCDGHVEWQKQVKWTELTEAAARRWNNDNRPHRELWFPGKMP